MFFCMSANASNDIDVSDFRFHYKIIDDSGALEIAKVYNPNGTEKGINEDIFNTVLDGYIGVGVFYCKSSKLIDAELSDAIEHIIRSDKDNKSKKNNYIKSFKNIGEFLFSDKGDFYLNTIKENGDKQYCNTIKSIVRERVKEIRKKMS